MEKTNIIKAGSRESRLAVIQSEIIINLIKKYNPELDIELLTMKTTGDKILDKTLDKIGGKGLFVKELDRALKENKVDITIHSLKDMPMMVNEDLPLIVYSKRESPYDVLVLPKGIDKIDFTKPFGCSSKRRSVQLKKLYPEAEIKPVRGNVLTRLNKLDSGEFSALILAEAGLKRLGLIDRIYKVFTADEMIPSAGQGIIVIQGRNNEDYSYIKMINDKNSEICAEIERAFVRELDGGCSSPIAGYCELISDNEFILRGLYSDNDSVITDKITGKINNGVKTAVEFAKKLKHDFEKRWYYVW